jgi:septal ring factor EnvC (AmiA/AmiB activator)
MDLLTILATGGILAAIISAISIITQVILNKKLRTPADKTTEFETILTFFKEGIKDSQEDRAALEQTIKDLRDYVGQLERESRESFQLTVKLEERIADLERRIAHKDARIKFLEEELARYVAKALGDPNVDTSTVAIPEQGEEK